MSKIWKLAQQYATRSKGEWRVMKVLFVDPDEAPPHLWNHLSSTDQSALSSDVLCDKPRVFEVVYDRICEQAGGPCRVRDQGPYLIFTPEPTDTPHGIVD